jgi:hypothetical protein
VITYESGMVVSGRLSKPLKVKKNANHLQQASTKTSERKVKTKKRQK